MKAMKKRTTLKQLKICLPPARGGSKHNIFSRRLTSEQKSEYISKHRYGNKFFLHNPQRNIFNKKSKYPVA